MVLNLNVLSKNRLTASKPDDSHISQCLFTDDGWMAGSTVDLLSKRWLFMSVCVANHICSSGIEQNLEENPEHFIRDKSV
jgi:hypothetical protein